MERKLVIDPTLQQAQRGDRSARARLLRDLQDPWFRLCVSLLGDAEMATDATQETALRFLKLLPTFRGDSSLKTWSMGIAINVVREMQRDRRRLAVIGEVPAPEQIADSPDQIVVREDAYRLLRATLAELPERQREALVLRYFEDLSVEQTASAMHCASGTVKATVHQALRALRTKLKQLI